MITIWLGRAGAAWDEAARLTGEARKQETPVVLLVPQQYTLTAERFLMDSLDAAGFFDVDVVSPARLSQRVFAQAGVSARTRIDSRGKAMAVARTLLTEKENLHFYESAARRQGLTDRLGKLIGDLKRAQLGPEALAAYAEGLPEGAEAEKLHDLSLLYAAYEGLLAGRFVYGEDVQNELIRRLPQAGLIRGARLIVCGFDLITEETGRLMIAAASAAESVHLILCDDRADEAFAPITDSVTRFCERLQQAGVRWTVAETEPRRDVLPPDIRWLERQVLASRPQPFQGVPGAVRLYAAPNPYAEASHAAEEILTLYAAGVPFSDIQVLCLKEETYFSVLDAVLTAWRIPHQLSRKLAAADVGAGRFLLCALRAVSGRYRPEDMIALIKTGFAGLTEDEVFRLENLILANGLRGGMFQKPFLRGGDEAIALEDARARLMEPLERLRVSLHDARGARESLTAMFGYLADTGAYDRLCADAERLEAEGRQAAASQLKQTWKTLMSLLDQMYELANDDRLTGEESVRLLTAGLEASELSALPQDAGSVLCGRLGNAALTHPAYLFVLGLNDPGTAGDGGGLLTNEESASLQERLRVYLALDDEGREQMARLDLYKALSAPRKGLYLSHAQALQDGTALRAHPMLRAIRECLPALIEEGGVTAPQGASRPLAVTPALEGMGRRLREGSLTGEWADAWRYLCRHEEQAARALLRGFDPPDPQAPLPPDVTHQLFLDRVSSVGRLETFAVCPFRHFVRYGLKPVERGEWKLKPTDQGSFYHRALEGFTRLLPSLPDWPNVTRAQVTALMNRAADSAADDLMQGVLSDSATARTEARRYRRLLGRVAWQFTEIARHSAFRPEQGDAELRFGYDDDGLPPVRLTLEDGSQVLVRGIVDRVERWRGDNGVYLRVIDFKMPDLALAPDKVYWGAQLQLLIYLRAALQAEENGIPAGAYYFHLSDPLLPDPGQKADVERKLAQALSLIGVTLRDAEIIRLMDDGNPPLSMPQLLKADGDFRENRQLASLEEMRALIGHAQRTATSLASAIAKGRAEAAPVTFAGEDSPCTRCQYQDICRVGAIRSAVTPREADAISYEELLEKTLREDHATNA